MNKLFYKTCLLSIFFFLICSIPFSKTTLRLALWDGSQGLQIIMECVKEFEKQNPDIEVKIEKPGYSVYYQKLLMQCAAGVEPDVVVLGLKQYRQFVSKNVLAPLNKFIHKDQENDLNDYYPGVIEQFSYNQNIYVMPRDITSFGVVYYNKDLFKKANIPIPHKTWSWDYKIRPDLKEKDFLWVLDNLTKFNQKGEVIQWSLAPWQYHFLADALALSAGGDYADNYRNPTKVTFNHPDIIKPYQFVSDLCHKKKYIPCNQTVSNIAQTTRRELWLNQKVALYMSGNWDIPVIRKRLNKNSKDWFEWDVINFPSYKDGGNRIPADACGYAMMKSSQHPQEAWRLINFLSGKFTMKKTTAAGLTQPANRKLALEYWIPKKDFPKEEQYPQNRICTDDLILNGFFEPRSEYWPRMSTFLTEELPLLWNNQASANNVLNIANTNAQKYLDRINNPASNSVLFNWNIALSITAILIMILAVWVLWPKKNTLPSKNNKLAYILLSPWLIGIICLTLGPVIISLILSGTEWDMILPAKWLGLQNYVEAFTQDDLFFNALMVSTLYTIVSVPIGVFISLLIALLLNIPVKGTKLFRLFFYLPCMASSVATSLIWRKMFQVQGGLINLFIYGKTGNENPLGLRGIVELFLGTSETIDWLGTKNTALGTLTFISFWSLGVCIIIFLARLQSLPKSRMEAAIIEGAGKWKRFYSITLPHLSPTIWFCLITGVIASFQVFTKAYVLTEGGPGHATEFYVLHLYKEAFISLRMGYACALAWILFGIIFLLTYIQIKKNRWINAEMEMK